MKMKKKQKQKLLFAIVVSIGVLLTTFRVMGLTYSLGAALLVGSLVYFHDEFKGVKDKKTKK